MGCCILGALILSRWICAFRAVRRIAGGTGRVLFPFVRLSRPPSLAGLPACMRGRPFVAALVVAELLLLGVAFHHAGYLVPAQARAVWSSWQPQARPAIPADLLIICGPGARNGAIRAAP